MTTAPQPLHSHLINQKQVEGSQTFKTRLQHSFLSNQKLDKGQKSPKKYLNQEQSQESETMTKSCSSTSPATLWSASSPLEFLHHHIYTTKSTAEEDSGTTNHTSIAGISPSRWTLRRTMVILCLFFLSSSSPVSSLPLRGGLDFQELTAIPHQPELTPSARQQQNEEVAAVVRDTERKREDDFPRNVNYVMQPQSQLYLPSILQSPEIGDENSVRFGDQRDESRENGPITQQHQHLHKLQRNSLGAGESSTNWETVIDPQLYLLTEWNSNPSQQQQQQRMRRNSGPSLSIVNPLDVLRQRLLLEIARRKMRQSHNQIMANAEILKNIGRRRRR